MKILILGHAGHGKTTVARLLADTLYLRHKDSSDLALDIFLYEELKHLGYTYPDKDAAYACRTSPWMRAIWFEAICKFNKDNPINLAVEILKIADIYVGMRALREFEAANRCNLFDHTIWIENPRIAYESATSMELGYDASMHFICNDGTYEDLENKVEELVECLNPLSHTDVQRH